MLSRVLRSSRRIRVPAHRMFSTASLQAEDAPGHHEETSIEAQSKKVGADLVFSEQKHGYVLTFPWNFPEVI